MFLPLHLNVALEAKGCSCKYSSQTVVRVNRDAQFHPSPPEQSAKCRMELLVWKGFDFPVMCSLKILKVHHFPSPYPPCFLFFCCLIFVSLGLMSLTII